MRPPRHAHCCLCGAPRRPTQRPVESFGNNVECITISEHRELQEGRWEESPQMLVSVSMWRNGGTSPGQTHICDDCIVVGLKAAKRFVDDALRALGASHVDGGELQEALEEIAQEHDAGRHDGLLEPSPALDADTMFAIARNALAKAGDAL